METYLGLFLAAFLAATLVPAASEVWLAGLLAAGHPAPALWAVATLGNTLGAVVNWALGRYLLHFQDRGWFPFDPGRLGRAQAWFRRYGVWSLVLAWAPLVGDGLTFLAGVMRVPLGWFVALVAAGKGVRYALVMALAQGLWPGPA